jgi:hypothetical protein
MVAGVAGWGWGSVAVSGVSRLFGQQEFPLLAQEPREKWGTRLNHKGHWGHRGNPSYHDAKRTRNVVMTLITKKKKKEATAATISDEGSG